MNQIKQLKKCEICPHRCKINRNEGNIGRCKSNDKIKIALASVHNYEEPCLSEINGSGTIFFSNCNLSCIYCQNYEISQQGKGKEVSIEELADIFFFILRFAQMNHIQLDEILLKKLEKNNQKYPVELAKGSNKKYTEFK